LHVAEAETVRALELATTPWNWRKPAINSRHSPMTEKHHQTHLGNLWLSGGVFALI